MSVFILKLPKERQEKDRLLKAAMVAQVAMNSHLADQRKIDSKRHTMAEHLANQTPGKKGAMVMAFEFPTVDAIHTVSKDGMESNIYDMAAHWDNVIKQYEPDDDR